MIVSVMARVRRPGSVTEVQDVLSPTRRAKRCNLRLFLELHMDGELGGTVFYTSIPEFCHVDSCEQIFARAHKDRAKHQMQFVDQAGTKVLLNRGNTAANPHVPILR